MNEPTSIAGYDYASRGIGASPVSIEELELLKKTVDLQEADLCYLRLAGEVLQDQTEEVVASWRAVIGANPHLIYYYFGLDGQPDDRYRLAVKERFKQWVLDVCFRPMDRDWLNYQHEIGMRHTHLRKNQVDGVVAPAHIPLRYIIAFTAVINNTVRPFLRKAGHSDEDVEAMHRAWCKVVQLQVALWSRPYVAESAW